MKAVFLDRDGVLNVERSYICKPEEIEMYQFTPEAVRKINDSEYLAILVTNQSAIARKLCTIDDVESVHNALKNELGRHLAHLDAIYFCPHFYDRDSSEIIPEYNIDCDCRKPKPGLLIRAAKDFGIDLKASYMIGDSERDILAGRRAGCKTIGVRTGYGLKDTSVQPDYVFDNLLEAVNFILISK